MSRDHVDVRRLRELTEQSQDLNSDAVRRTRAALGEFAEESAAVRGRSRWSRAGLVGALTGAGGLLGMGRAAASPEDVMALQTAASIENLMVSVYKTAADLPFIKQGNKTIAEFISKTMEQHKAHGEAYNSAATQAGGKAQTGPNPRYDAEVKKALPGLKAPADVVKLALSLEDVAAQTYTKNISQVSDAKLRGLFAGIAPVEAQHRAVLLTVQALLADGKTDLIAIPTQPEKLPDTVGSVGIPNVFYPTNNASPINEGAVK
ncbi:ferritin-like domain-containing protein [Actinomadura scrupuli]|uniref:ferritin-like domain-containing protein n=1 Tax=Actinomadura scrupuli TaxID=559629 RepID=UPI003D961A01